MQVIFDKILKRRIIDLIKDLGGDVYELILDIPLSLGTFNTIEYDESQDDIILHVLEYDFDFPFLFEELPDEDKLRIYQILKGI